MRITKRQLRRLIKESADDTRVKRIAEKASRLLAEDSDDAGPDKISAKFFDEEINKLSGKEAKQLLFTVMVDTVPDPDPLYIEIMKVMINDYDPGKAVQTLNKARDASDKKYIFDKALIKLLKKKRNME